MADDIPTLLGQCPTFSGLSPERLEQLAQGAQLRRLPARSLLFVQGDPCPGIYVIASGAVRIFKLAPSGKEHLLRGLDAPQSFLEVAVIGGFSCPACAETTLPSTLVLIDGARFSSLLTKDHQFCLQILCGLSTRVRSLVGLLEDIVLRDATAHTRAPTPHKSQVRPRCRHATRLVRAQGR